MLDRVGTLASLRGSEQNVTSQFGEDGILASVMDQLVRPQDTDRWCVEFGAWDGRHLSNTYNLIAHHGFQGVLIEGDAARYEELRRNMKDLPTHEVCAFVDVAGPMRLDALLAATPIPAEFDLLSVDIDGCDWHVWKSLADHRPRVVCIEYNPTIPNAVDFVQPQDFGIKWGSSARAFQRLAEEKAYVLVAVTRTNLIFVAAEAWPEAGGSLEELRWWGRDGVFVFSAFDGTLLFSEPTIDMPWHSMKVRSERLQALPGFLRGYPDDQSALRRGLLRLWKRLLRR